jgi:trehalose synthase-fused probable maltokinase
MSSEAGPHEYLLADALPTGFAEWVARQRWYGAKATIPQLERIGGWSIDHDDVRISTHYILDHGHDRVTLYQVPLTERLEPLPSLTPIGMAGESYIYDAPHDPAYARAILELILCEDEVGGARGHRQPGTPALVISASAVLRGEQSNTSIICRVDEGTPVMLKVFRTLHNGANPDVVLQSAIAAAGSLLVPTSVGFLSGQWPDSGQPDGIARGHLAFAQEFLPGAEDAWRVALTAAGTGHDFAVRARTLGEATAAVHATLAAVLPTRAPTLADIDSIITGMRRRLNLALREVPTLENCRSSIERLFELARTAPWPLLQRIHGDYHLGQVLDVPGRGWVLVDFEGEPLREMTERSELDVTLRDVAGMLRSFDYAAGSVTLAGGGSGPAESVAAWAPAARHGFVDGYIARSGVDLRQRHEVLDAFEIDKALYEAVYEARNRPDWIAIPVAAIRRLSHCATS